MIAIYQGRGVKLKLEPEAQAILAEIVEQKK